MPKRFWKRTGWEPIDRLCAVVVLWTLLCTLEIPGAEALVGNSPATNGLQAAETRQTSATRSPSASLREKFQSQFLVGVALDGRLPGDYSPRELSLIRTQFAALTPANCLKMMHVQRREGRFDFDLADAFVAFAQTNRLTACGHCLVWAKDERTPEWIFKEGDHPVSREVLLERMRRYIQVVAGRYRGKLVSWDVVNEPLDDGDKFIRPSSWLSIIGEDFIAEAFRSAHEAAPEATLILNDYNVELPGKRAKLLRLLSSLQEKHVPIDAVGIQGHYELDSVPYQDIEDTLVAIHRLGLKVVITECDIDVVTRARWWADGGKYRDELSRFNPFLTNCPPAVLERQGEQYAKLFQIFEQHPEVIGRITFWDLHDGRSWLNHFPWERVNYPLLFDRETQPKPAFKALMALP